MVSVKGAPDEGLKTEAQGLNLAHHLYLRNKVLREPSNVHLLT